MPDVNFLFAYDNIPFIGVNFDSIRVYKYKRTNITLNTSVATKPQVMGV
jgi:hypothetical protein